MQRHCLPFKRWCVYTGKWANYLQSGGRLHPVEKTARYRCAARRLSRNSTAGGGGSVVLSFVLSFIKRESLKFKTINFNGT